MSENTSVAISPLSRKNLERLPTKSERTRQAILESALEFFWTHPFRDLSVGELMARAGASRPTFYQYFADLHDLMAVLLDTLRADVFSATAPWFEGRGDPVPELKAALTGLVEVCYERGTLLKAVADAAVTDANLEKVWRQFMNSFDVTVAARIEQQQAEGFIESFPAYPVAVALDRLNAFVLIEHFGRRPRGKRDEVLSALTRVWSSTLYRTAG